MVDVVAAEDDVVAVAADVFAPRYDDERGEHVVENVWVAGVGGSVVVARV